jgi:hypothetical protein
MAGSVRCDVTPEGGKTRNSEAVTKCDAFRLGRTGGVRRVAILAQTQKLDGRRNRCGRFRSYPVKVFDCQNCGAAEKLGALVAAGRLCAAECCGNCGGRGWRPALRCSSGRVLAPSRSTSRADSVGAWIDRLRKYQPTATGRSILRPKLFTCPVFPGLFAQNLARKRSSFAAGSSIFGAEVRPGRGRNVVLLAGARQTRAEALGIGIGRGIPVRIRVRNGY